MPSGRLSAGLIALALAVVPAAAGPPGAVGPDDLVRMGRDDLLALYQGAPPAPVPRGYVPGRAILNPGSKITLPASRATRVLWQGKVFRDDGVMINRVFGVFRAVPAGVNYGESWYDGGPALVMDYAGTARLFTDYRDEVREVAPGVYLGLTYRRKCPAPELATFFALDARGRCR